VTASIYRFRNFTLDPRTRELHRDGERLVVPVSTIECMTYLIRHRDRSVGRDELVAAVWGRADISEISLSHAIMRARRLLGDSGSEQRSIRTLPRMGYRWIIEPTIEEALADSPSSVVVALPSPASSSPDVEAPIAAKQPRARRRIATFTAIASACLVAGVVALGVFRFAHHDGSAPGAVGTSAAAPTAMVLPAEIETASVDWAWLRFGAMDLIANRLRLGGVATTPSETVVGLVNAGRIDAALAASNDSGVNAADALFVRPSISSIDGAWRVRLRGSRHGEMLEVETEAVDVLVATRRAADDLLLKLGHAPPASGAADMPASAAELAQRINAAVLSGQIELAHTLIDAAPKDIAALPDVVLAEANLDYAGGDYPAALRRIDALLDALPAAQFPLLRARALNRRGAIRYQLGERADADRDFVDAIGLLELHSDPDALASAYSGRGAIAGLDLRWDEAVGFFGQARSLRLMIDDAYGLASLDLNLGAVEMARGRPAAAVPMFERAAARLQELGTPEALAAALRDLANAQLLLLRYDDALATTARFWPVDAHTGNQRERWSLTLTRAAALAAKGRLGEAELLLAQIEHDSDLHADAFERADAASLAADIALDRNDDAGAAELAARALTPQYAATAGVAYAIAWLERIRGLQGSGQLAPAAAAIVQFEAWSKLAPDPRSAFLVALAAADQAGAEGTPLQARTRYADAMARAENIGVPEYLLLAGEPYVENLLAAGRLDEAAAIAGRLGEFAGADARAAWVQALLYTNLHKPAAAQKAYAKARELAGERVLPPLPSPANP